MNSVCTFLRDGSANVHIRGFVFDVLSQSEDVLQLGVSLLQIHFCHLKIKCKYSYCDFFKVSFVFEGFDGFRVYFVIHFVAANLKASDNRPDLVGVPHSHDVRLEHLGDEEQPVGQFCGSLVEVGGAHRVRHVPGSEVGILAGQADHLNSVLLMRPGRDGRLEGLSELAVQRFPGRGEVLHLTLEARKGV